MFLTKQLKRDIVGHAYGEVTINNAATIVDGLFIQIDHDVQHILASMHQSFETMAPHPQGRAGDSHGNERGFDQSFAVAMRG